MTNLKRLEVLLQKKFPDVIIHVRPGAQTEFVISIDPPVNQSKQNEVRKATEALLHTSVEWDPTRVTE